MTANPPTLPAPSRTRHELGRVGDPHGGPTLVALGGIHGNEPSGVAAIKRVLAVLEHDHTGLQGCLVGLVGNRPALGARRRYVDEDLNRVWHPERVATAHLDDSSEAAELVGLAREVHALETLVPRLAFLDLHSTSGGGAPFSVLDDSLANRKVGLALPVPCVLGLEEELGGTFLNYMSDRGHVGVGFEAGQHDDPRSVDRAEAALWIMLSETGALADDRAEVQRSRRLLARETRGLPRIVEVRYRHDLLPDDDFTMEPGFENFDPISEGESLALHGGRSITAPMGGMMLMPLYQGQGNDGFFIVHRVRRAWLALSRLLRQVQAGRAAHLLPGVRRDPEVPGGVLVDLDRARWLALPFFHLLGYRRRFRTETMLGMVPRREARPPGDGPILPTN